MKKILLINSSLQIGGIETAMIHAANFLSEQYDVTVFCYAAAGELTGELSPRVKLIEGEWRTQCLYLSLRQCYQKGLRYFLFKLFAGTWSHLVNNTWPISLAVAKEKTLGEFDLACAFRHEGAKHRTNSGFISFLCEKVESPCRLSWIHFDPEIFTEYFVPKKYEKKLNGIVCVSESVADAFRTRFSNLPWPVYACPNFLDFAKVKEESEMPLDTPYPADSLICFSASRLGPEKGFERAIDAFHETFLTNPEVYWFIAGSGSQEEAIRERIAAYHLEKQIVLLGNKPNPFPYMKNADMYLNVSYKEAAPMVFLEAKSLGVPVFATRTLSAEELLKGAPHYLAENEAESLKQRFNETIEKVKKEKASAGASSREVAAEMKEGSAPAKDNPNAVAENNEKAFRQFAGWIFGNGENKWRVATAKRNDETRARRRFRRKRFRQPRVRIRQ